VGARMGNEAAWAPCESGAGGRTDARTGAVSASVQTLGPDGSSSVVYEI
jgi:hypothetical protein